MATVTPVVCTIRCGEQHHAYGDPYEFVATASLRGDTAYICGCCGVWRHEWRAEIAEALRPLGIKAVEYERVRSGALYQRTVRDGAVLD